ncbi:hypothetical protein NKG05_04825 [Oerskovia sp. M15]
MIAPYIWRNDTDTGWVIDYPNYALQAVAMYMVICLAGAWFGTRLRQLALRAEHLEHDLPLPDRSMILRVHREKVLGLFADPGSDGRGVMDWA